MKLTHFLALAESFTIQEFENVQVRSRVRRKTKLLFVFSKEAHPNVL